LSLEDFKTKQEKEFKKKSEKLSKITNGELVQDYAMLIQNTLRFVSNPGQDCTCRIKKKNLLHIISLLDNFCTTYIEDIITYAVLNWKGTGVPKNAKKAKKIISNPLCEDDGRALVLNYLMLGKTDVSTLVKSCVLGNSQAFSLVSSVF